MRLEQVFKDNQKFLWGLSYRMTGSAADADDILQETFVRLMQKPPADTEEPLRPWLVRVALNLSRDLLRRRRRQGYVGQWLPAPFETENNDDLLSLLDLQAATLTTDSRDPSARYEMLESVSFAFLLALEALTPTQRAVLLLRDVFDYSVKETGDALDMTETNVKTTHHRARRAMDAYDRRRQVPTADVQRQARETLTSFLRCLEQHDVRGIEALLAENVRSMTDGGGEFQAALRPIVGRDKVMRFYLAVTDTGPDVGVQMPTLNGMPGVIVDFPSARRPQAPRLALTIDLDPDGKISWIYVVSASRKL